MLEGRWSAAGRWSVAVWSGVGWLGAAWPAVGTREFLGAGVLQWLAGLRAAAWSAAGLSAAELRAVAWLGVAWLGVA